MYKNQKTAKKYKHQWYIKNKERIKKYILKNKNKIKQQNKQYYQKNKNKILKNLKIKYKNNKNKIIQKVKHYYILNKSKIIKYQKYYNNKNKIKIKEKKRQYQHDNRNKINKHMKNRYDNDINFKIITNLRHRIIHAIKGNSKSSKTKELLGCTIDQLKEHLQSKFTEGMTWKNYGKWHVDHIRPCASFDLSTPEQQKECFHYSNLQPLWAEDNLKKSDKLF